MSCGFSSFFSVSLYGYSLDDKRQPVKENDLPDIVARWHNRGAEAGRKRTEQSFLVPKAEIARNDYDLSINRYKEIVYEAVEYDPPGVILDELEKLELEIQAGMKELRGLLGPSATTS